MVVAAVPQPHPRHPQPVVVGVLEVEAEPAPIRGQYRGQLSTNHSPPGVVAVGLEADGEEREGEVGHGDGEPGDELVLQRRHVARQQRLDTTQVGSRADNETSQFSQYSPCPLLDTSQQIPSFFASLISAFNKAPKCLFKINANGCPWVLCLPLKFLSVSPKLLATII